MSFNPFLNSTSPLPKDRPTSGSRLPNSSTAITSTISISCGPSLNITLPLAMLIPLAVLQPHTCSHRLRLGFARVVLLVLDALHAFLELDHSLAQRAHHARQATAEQNQHDEGNDQKLLNA